jgi:hypothetical protein
MFSEENLPGRLIAGATDEPARSFKPSEEDNPVRAGYLLLKSLKNHLPHFRRSMESSLKRFVSALSSPAPAPEGTAWLKKLPQQAQAISFELWLHPEK